MSFHEVQFPSDIGYDSAGGPAFDTAVVELDSGAEERLSRRSKARRSYDVLYGRRELADYAAILDFFHVRLGRAVGFRYKDWTDFTTASDHRAAPDDEDEQIGVGDGSTVAFQLVKKYSSGGSTHTRNLRKPVDGTVVVALDGVNQASGWSVDTTTGVVTFSSAPGVGVIVTAGCEFDVPVRCDVDVLELSISDFEEGVVKSLPLLELLDDDDAEEDYNYGGAKDHGIITADVSINTLIARVHIVRQTAAGLAINLPDYTSLDLGGPYFYLVNNGSTSIAVKNHLGSTVVTLAASEARVLVLGTVGATKTWFAV